MVGKSHAFDPIPGTFAVQVIVVRVIFMDKIKAKL